MGAIDSVCFTHCCVSPADSATPKALNKSALQYSIAPVADASVMAIAALRDARRERRWDFIVIALRPRRHEQPVFLLLR